MVHSMAAHSAAPSTIATERSITSTCHHARKHCETEYYRIRKVFLTSTIATERSITGDICV